MSNSLDRPPIGGFDMTASMNLPRLLGKFILAQDCLVCSLFIEGDHQEAP